MSSAEEIQCALAHIQPDDRDTWVKMAMAVKNELGETGRDIWDAWSQGADSYNAADARAVWRSVRETGGMTISTLFHLASQNGYDPRSASPPSANETAKRKAERERRAEAERAELERQRAEAAAKAGKLWAAGCSVGSGHSYMTRKQTRPTNTMRELPADQVAQVIGYRPTCKGNPLEGRILLIPVKLDGRLSTIEMIDEQGRKAALSGGAKKDGYWAAQPLPEGDGAGFTVAVGEGVATVLSSCEATGYLGVAALTCGNLGSVAVTMRKRYPEAKIVILADLGNGQRDAEKAAGAVNGLIA